MDNDYDRSWWAEISLMLPLGEGCFNSYEDLLHKEKLGNEKTRECEWVGQEWLNLVNDKRRSQDIKKLWKLNLGQYKNAKRDNNLEQFTNDEVWCKW